MKESVKLIILIVIFALLIGSIVLYNHRDIIENNTEEDIGIESEVENDDYVNNSSTETSN